MAKTATEMLSIQQRDERIDLVQLAEAQTRFVLAWKPKNPFDAEQFERNLNYLLHLAAREAVAPIVKQYTEQMMALLARTPNQPSILFPKETTT